MTLGSNLPDRAIEPVLRAGALHWEVRREQGYCWRCFSAVAMSWSMFLKTFSQVHSLFSPTTVLSKAVKTPWTNRGSVFSCP